MNRLDPDSLYYRKEPAMPKLDVLFFESNTCQKCHAVWPKLKPYADAAGVPLRAVNADGDQKTAAAFGVMGFPTIVAIRDGQVVARLEPSATWSAMRGLVDELAGGAR